MFRKDLHVITPKLIGAFSVDQNRNYIDNLNNLRYVKDVSQLPIDLTSGKSVVKASYDPYERLHQITGFLKDRKNEVELVNNNVNKVDIVCSSGVLKSIMTAKYDSISCVLDAFKFQNRIFLCMNPPTTEQPSNKFSRYGFKFESYVQASEFNGLPPGSAKDVIEAEEFIIVNKARIGDIDVIFSCEIDGVESNEKITDLNKLLGKNLVEVKLKSIDGFEEMKNNDKKLVLPWWCSAYLAGIKKFVVGIRGNRGNDEDIVRRIEKKSLDELSKSLNDIVKPDSILFLRENLKTIHNEVNGRLKGNSPVEFCRFECNKDLQPNKRVLSLVGTYPIDDEIKSKTFFKNIIDIYYINNM